MPSTTNNIDWGATRIIPRALICSSLNMTNATAHTDDTVTSLDNIYDPSKANYIGVVLYEANSNTASKFYKSYKGQGYCICLEKNSIIKEQP